MAKKQKKKRSKVGYVVGSVILCASAMVLMPTVIDAVSSYIYKKKAPPEAGNDNWGPEIVRKEEVDK